MEFLEVLFKIFCSSPHVPQKFHFFSKHIGGNKEQLFPPQGLLKLQSKMILVLLNILKLSHYLRLISLFLLVFGSLPCYDQKTLKNY